MRTMSISDEEFRAAVQPGDTASAVAGRLSITSSWVRIRCKQLGIRLAKARGPKRPSTDWTKLDLSKMTVAQAAAITGLTRARIYQRCRETGVKCLPG